MKLKIDPSLTIEQVRSLHRAARREVNTLHRRMDELLAEVDRIQNHVDSPDGPGILLDSYAARIVEMKHERKAARKQEATK
jgi:hypothetical protein